MSEETRESIEKQWGSSLVPYLDKIKALTAERDSLNKLYQTQLKTNEAQAVELSQLRAKRDRWEQCNDQLTHFLNREKEHAGRLQADIEKLKAERDDLIEDKAKIDMFLTEKIQEVFALKARAGRMEKALKVGLDCAKSLAAFGRFVGSNQQDANVRLIESALSEGGGKVDCDFCGEAKVAPSENGGTPICQSCAGVVGE